jgi:hypothetical protein
MIRRTFRMPDFASDCLWTSGVSCTMHTAGCFVIAIPKLPGKVHTFTEGQGPENYVYGWLLS